MARKQLNTVIIINNDLSLKEKIQSILQPQIDSNKKLSPFFMENFWQKYYPTILLDIKQYSIDNTIVYKNLSELIYLIINDKITKPICICGNEITTFISYNMGYNHHCSVKCSNGSPTSIKQRISTYKDTVQKKYGVDNISQLQSIKDKKEQTMIANFGVSYNSQRPEIKIKLAAHLQTEEHQEAIKSGCIKSLGVSNPSLSQLILDNRQVTFDNKKLIRFTEYAQNLNISINHITDGLINCFCNKCNDSFDINYNMFMYRMIQKLDICTIHNVYTNGGTSLKEDAIVSLIKENYTGQIILSDRKILNGKELDIYLPELNLAIEFNGLYWHSELHKDKNYHIDKTLNCEKLGIKLIHIWEDDFIEKYDILKSRILNLLNKSNRIYGRDCVVKEVDHFSAKEFIKKNHLLNYVQSQINSGLYYNNELVALMTFGKRFDKFEMLRFCNKLNTTVIGGATKLFNHFISDYKEYDKIYTYTDLSWGKSNTYQNLNFKLKSESEPNFTWVIDGKKRISNLKVTKEFLIKNNMINPNETIEQCMYRHGYYRIYDCGSMLFEWNRQ